MKYFLFMCLPFFLFADEFSNFLNGELKILEDLLTDQRENIENELDIQQYYYLLGQINEAKIILEKYSE